MSNGLEATLRRPVTEDVARLAELHVRSWRLAYGPLMGPPATARFRVEERTHYWRELLADEGPHHGAWLAALPAGSIAGFVHWRLLRSPAELANAPRPRSDDPWAGVGEIESIHVAPELRGRGMGRQLMSAAMDEMARAGVRVPILWVLPDNTAARAFYERLGWTFDGYSVRRPLGDFPGLPIVTELRYRGVIRDGGRSGVDPM